MISSFHSIQSMYTAVYYHRTSRIFDFMIADALSMVPDFIDEIVSEVDTFLEYDDHTIIEVIKERAKKEGSKSYTKAMEILEMVRYRQKMYKCILEFPLSFPLIVKKKPQKDIERICTRIKEFSSECGATDFNLRLDYRQTIKPVGINLEDIFKWLKGKRVYDTEDNRIKPLQEMSRTYFRTLLHYSILLRIFVDRKKSKKYPHVIEKIRKKARGELGGLETEWSTLLLS